MASYCLRVIEIIEPCRLPASLVGGRMERCGLQLSGAGAMGGLYGAFLARAGYDVHFLIAARL